MPADCTHRVLDDSDAGIDLALLLLGAAAVERAVAGRRTQRRVTVVWPVPYVVLAVPPLCLVEQRIEVFLRGGERGHRLVLDVLQRPVRRYVWLAAESKSAQTSCFEGHSKANKFGLSTKTNSSFVSA